MVFRDVQLEAANDLLYNLEAWDRVPENHRADTPRRMVQSLRELTERKEFSFTTFDAADHDMISLGPIPFYTLCAHHVVPFYGSAYVSYIPSNRIAGLSKFVRAVQYCAKGLWVQEDLTKEIGDFLESKLDPTGVAIVLDAEHMCMAMRGVATAGVITRTASMRGVYADHSRTAKAEFMDYIKDVKK